MGYNFSLAILTQRTGRALERLIWHGYDLVMAKLTVELPDELSNRLGARAVEEGYGSVEAYVAGLIRDDVEEIDYGAPEHLRVRSSRELEEKLTEGLASPASEMTDRLWAEMRQRLIERHGGAK